MNSSSESVADLRQQAVEHRRKTLLQPCWHWVTPLANDDVHKIAADLFDAFERWKHRQADDSGNVTVYRNTFGLLATGKPQSVPLADAMPWECGGMFVRDEIDLAFKLWLDEDSEFKPLIQRHGLPLTLSVVGLLAEDPTDDSLVRLNGMLVQTLMAEAMFQAKDAKEDAQLLAKFAKALGRKRQQELTNMAKAREELNRKRLADMEDVKQLYWNEAVDYKARHPSAKKPEILIHLESCALPERKRSVISRYIAGAMAAGLKRVGLRGPSLYSTKQPGNS